MMNQQYYCRVFERGFIKLVLFCLFMSIVTLSRANSTILVMGDSLSADYKSKQVHGQSLMPALVAKQAQAA